MASPALWCCGTPLSTRKPLVMAALQSGWPGASTRTPSSRSVGTGAAAKRPLAAPRCITTSGVNSRSSTSCCRWKENWRSLKITRADPVIRLCWLCLTCQMVEKYHRQNFEFSVHFFQQRVVTERKKKPIKCLFLWPNIFSTSCTGSLDLWVNIIIQPTSPEEAPPPNPLSCGPIQRSAEGSRLKRLYRSRWRSFDHSLHALIRRSDFWPIN